MSVVGSARRRPRAAILIILASTLAILLPTGVLAVKPPAVTQIQLLDLSDWHGQIDPLAGGIGGAAYLSTYFKNDRALYPNTLTLTAGDDVGATPPLSSFFDDEPAILAERLMGIQVGTLGNHNFDGGLERLQTQIDLARSKKDVGTPFQYVSANLSNRDQNIQHVKDYALFNYKGVVVAVIGVTNEEAPSLVFPGNFGTMTPTDSAAAAVAARAAAEAAGANVFVAITHKGVRGFNGADPFGELIDFANAVSGFDVIFGDHTDIQWSGTINGQFVVENRSKGATYSRTILDVTKQTGTVVIGSHTFVVPTNAGVTPDQAILDMRQPYFDALSPIFSTVIGESSLEILRSDRCGQSAGRTCESRVGDTVTDAMRLTYGTDFAITNSGGLRDRLTCPTAGSGGLFCAAYTPSPNYTITRGSAQAVLPFGNQAVTLSVNGAELKTILENSVSSMPGANGRFGQVSGLCFTYGVEAAVGSRVTGAVRQAPDGTCTGAAVDLTSGSSYTVAMNDFMVSGGDGYPNFFARAVTRDILVNVLADWITDNSPLNPVYQNRIVCFDANVGTGNACPIILE